MKSFIKGLLGIALPILLTYLASGYDNIFLTIGVLVVSFAVSAFIFRANILMLIGTRKYADDPQKAIKIMRTAYKTGKMRPTFQLYFAYILLRNGELDEAETIINKAIVIGKHSLGEPEIKASEFNRALITWKRGDLSSAIVELEELYDDGYHTSALYGSLSCFYLINKEFDKAVELAREGIEYSDTDLISRDNLGQAYIGLGMLDEAEEVYDLLLPKDPKFMEPYFNYATIMEKRGNLAKAKEYYETALTFEEKFLSTITHDEICSAIDRVSELMI